MELSLKNKFSLLFSLVLFIFFLTECGGTKEKEQSEVNKTDSAGFRKKSVNPNGDSELALLMREMRKNADSLKEQVKAGGISGKFPEAFLKIHTASPTDADTKRESFNSYARNYIFNLQELYRSPKSELTKNYNAVVNSCLSCHSDHCPGPIPSIKKLLIAE